MTVKKLTVIKQGDQYEVSDPNNEEYPLVGPYSTWAEANEVRKGLTRTYQENQDL